MFTGIIHTIGNVEEFIRKGNTARITVGHGGMLTNMNIGDSVAVDGVCLSVVEVSPSVFGSDISGESLRLTTLGDIRHGAKVNLEKALTPSTPMGGHFITGHVDGVGSVERRAAEGEFALFDFRIPDGLKSQIARKGSVAVDGISLTVAEVFKNGFRVAVIPHTLKSTTLSAKKEGGSVNIETDVIAKYVERFLSVHTKQGVDEAFLKEHGFIRD